MAHPASSASPSTSANTAEKKAQSEMDEGVKVTIRLVAMDEEGREVKPVNEQVTYLHVVRMGTKPSQVISVPNASSSGDAVEGEVKADGEKEKEKEKEDVLEDTRPWVVRVIKREAIVCILSFKFLTMHNNLIHLDRDTYVPPPRDIRPRLSHILQLKPYRNSPDHLSTKLADRRAAHRRARPRHSKRMSALPLFAPRSRALTVQASRRLPGVRD